MADIGKLYNKPHITAYDLDGKSLGLIIEKLEMMEIWDQKKMKKVPKPVLRFRGAKKYYILGEKTAKQIARILESRDYDDWVGRGITLYSEKKIDTRTGEQIEVVRVSDKLPALKPPQAQQQTQQPAAESDQVVIEDRTEETPEETRARILTRTNEETRQNKKAAGKSVF